MQNEDIFFEICKNLNIVDKINTSHSVFGKVENIPEGTKNMLLREAFLHILDNAFHCKTKGCNGLYNYNKNDSDELCDYCSYCDVCGQPYPLDKQGFCCVCLCSVCGECFLLCNVCEKEFCKRHNVYNKCDVCQDIFAQMKIAVR